MSFCRVRAENENFSSLSSALRLTSAVEGIE